MHLSELEDLCEAGKKRFINELSISLNKCFKFNSKNDKTLNKKDIINLPINEVNKNLVILSKKIIAEALLLGYTHASGKIALADVTPLPFEEAIDFLKAKVPMTKEEWPELEPKLRFRAFTVARLAEVDNIERMKKTIWQGLEKGKSFQETWQSVKNHFEKMGAGYFETVYRTNIQTAYSAGRLMQYQNNMPPAWELLVIEDGRTSDTCKGIVSQIGNGHALPSNHGFWQTVGFPPYHFNCRTSFRAVYDYELKNGTTELITTPIENIRFKAQKGFGGNPIAKESFWKLTPAMIKRATDYGVIGDIVKQARDLDMQSYFPELLKGFKPVYKGKKKGYVQIASNWEYNADEIMSAQRLADEGHKIYMLPRTIKAKSPDMIIDDEIGEMKHLDTIVQGTIRKHIKYSGEAQRARIVYINVKSEKQKIRVLKIMKEEIKNLPLKKLLLDYNGVIKTFDRKYFE